MPSHGRGRVRRPRSSPEAESETGGRDRARRPIPSPEAEVRRPRPSPEAEVESGSTEGPENTPETPITTTSRTHIVSSLVLGATVYRLIDLHIHCAP